MAGGSYQHFQIIGNISGELHAALKKRPCSVGSNDLRLRVSPEGYTYPDVVVICGDPRFADNQHDTLLNPTLIVEVLSPSPKPTTVASSSPNTAPSNRSKNTSWSLKPSPRRSLPPSARRPLAVVGSLRARICVPLRQPGLQPRPRRHLRQGDVPPADPSPPSGPRVKPLAERAAVHAAPRGGAQPPAHLEIRLRP